MADDWDLDNDWGDDNSTSEVADIPLKTSIHLRRAEKRAMQRIAKRQSITQWLTHLPEPQETWHIISDATYDFWTWTPVILDLLKAPCELYGSTWTMNRDNALEALELFDNGKIRTLNILTGDYFKRRETAVYAEIYLGLQSRGQRYAAFKNHAKVLLITNEIDYLVIEGSANFTSNPRRENYTFTNDKELYLFHKSWMDEILLLESGK